MPGYSEVVNMDPSVMAMLQKSISAKLCPTVIGRLAFCNVPVPYRTVTPFIVSSVGAKYVVGTKVGT